MKETYVIKANLPEDEITVFDSAKSRDELHEKLDELIDSGASYLIVSKM